MTPPTRPPPAPRPSSDPPRVLGIDLGEARIGLALSDSLGMLAHPRETLRVDRAKPATEKAALARIKEIARQEAVRLIVLGLPRNMNGTEGPAAEKARAFADRLRKETSCEVRLLDERLTTVAAQKALHASGRNVKQGPGRHRSGRGTDDSPDVPGWRGVAPGRASGGSPGRAVAKSCRGGSKRACGGRRGRTAPADRGVRRRTVSGLAKPGARRYDPGPAGNGLCRALRTADHGTRVRAHGCRGPRPRPGGPRGRAGPGPASCRAMARGAERASAAADPCPGGAARPAGISRPFFRPGKNLSVSHLECRRAEPFPGGPGLALSRPAGPGGAAPDGATPGGDHDFAGFSANRGRPPESTVRTIHRIDLARRGHLLTLAYEGSGFLYKMVRLLTGSIVRCAQGRADPGWISAMLAGQARQASPPRLRGYI